MCGKIYHVKGWLAKHEGEVKVTKRKRKELIRKRPGRFWQSFDEYFDECLCV